MKLLLGFCAAAFALSGASLNSVRLLNAGTPTLSDGSDYVGPYTLRVNGRNMPVLCIDFMGQSHPGASWSAHLSKLDGSLQHTYQPSGLAQYEEEAYLCGLIVKPGADRIALQHAAWGIMDAFYIPDQTSLIWIALAQRSYGGVDRSRFEIISDVNRSLVARNQEFIAAVTPEPPLIELLGGLIALVSAAFGIERRRKDSER